MKTQVIFRKFPEGDVIALFPNEKQGWHGSTSYIMSYMRTGQHGDASPELITDMKKATKKEYTALKKELESIGYKLEVLDENSN